MMAGDEGVGNGNEQPRTPSTQTALFAGRWERWRSKGQSRLDQGIKGSNP